MSEPNTRIRIWRGRESDGSHGTDGDLPVCDSFGGCALKTVHATGILSPLSVTNSPKRISFLLPTDDRRRRRSPSPSAKIIIVVN